MSLHVRPLARGRRVSSLRRVATVGAAALALGGCVIDLGGLGGSWASAEAINDCGVVVGAAFTADERPHAFRAVPRRPLVDINGSFEESSALSVNGSGVAVGSAVIAGQRQAVRWAPDGRATVLGIGAGSEATDINDAGTIVGHRVGPSGLDEAFVRDGATGVVTTLAPVRPGTSHRASAINERGDVVGQAGFVTPILWEAPDHQPIALPDRSLLTVATDINDRGDVVGTASEAHIVTHALVWPAGSHEAVELPAPEDVNGTAATGITNDGVVVGHTYAYGAGQYRAVRWTLDGGQPTDLGDIGGRSSAAMAVNESGQAVGWADLLERSPTGTRVQHAVRFLVPDDRSGSRAPTPAGGCPSSMGTWSDGVAALPAQVMGGT